jgi:hypothetical protein
VGFKNCGRWSCHYGGLRYGPGDAFRLLKGLIDAELTQPARVTSMAWSG